MEMEGKVIKEGKLETYGKQWKIRREQTNKQTSKETKKHVPQDNRSGETGNDNIIPSIEEVRFPLFQAIRFLMQNITYARNTGLCTILRY